jgi:hypothetical protein
MRIIFADKLPPNGNGHYVHYYHKTSKHNQWTQIDLKKNINDNINDWISDLDEWHSNLCRVGESAYEHWWLTRASRIIAWVPHMHQTLFFSVSLIKVLENLNIDDLYIISAPNEIAKYIKDVHEDWDIRIESNESSFIKFKKYIIPILTPYKMMFDGFKRSFSTQAPSVDKNKKFKAIVYTHLLNYSIFKKSGDHYFGKMFDNKDGGLNKELYWIFYSGIGDVKKERKFIKEIQDTIPNACILQDHISFKEITKIIFLARKYNKKMKEIKSNVPILVIGGLTLKSYSSIYYNTLIKNNAPITEFQIQMAFNKITKQVNSSSIIYPFEDKGLERAILSQTKNKLKNIGYAHAVHSIGHLYLNRRTKDKVSSPQPDLMACTGEGAKNWLIKTQNFDENFLVPIGTKRHALPINKTQLRKNGELQLLLIIGQGYEITMFTNYVELDPTTFNSCCLTIRPYPFDDKKLQEQSIDKLKSILKSVKIENQTLEKQIEDCDLAIFSSTSAGYEAMLRGRLSLYVDLHHVVPLNAIEGKGNILDIFVANNIQEIRGIINQVQSLSMSEYQALAKRQISFAENVYAPVDHLNIQEVLSNNLVERT